MKRLPIYDIDLNSLDNSENGGEYNKPVTVKSCQDECLSMVITLLGVLLGKDFGCEYLSNCIKNEIYGNIYNVLEFVKQNGISEKSACKKDDSVYKIESILNISQVYKDKTDNFQVNRLKNVVEKGPVITSFLVLDDFSSEGVYIAGDRSKFKGFSYGLVTGWGVSGDIEYWVCQNSEYGVWKHAMFPYNRLSCVDVSIIVDNYRRVPWEYAHNNVLGGMIKVDVNKELQQRGNIKQVSVYKKFKDHSFLKSLFSILLLVLIFSKFF